MFLLLLSSLSLNVLELDTTTGYRRYYTALRDYLVRNADHPTRLRVVGKEDKGRTGNFEVTVPGTGQVLHSKRHNAGQGRAESAQAKRLILEQVNELIAEMIARGEEAASGEGVQEGEDVEA
jgi:hypothetical protein